ncbi:MAG: 3-oxoacyl-ACP synthase [Bacillota bacterium]|nr:3-oxoacyl-ACP synthase [Bacillota bacterium]
MAADLYLEGLGWFLPAATMTAHDLMAASGIPEEILRQKFGLLEKHIAGPKESPSEMAARAGKQALEEAGLAPRDIDGIIYFGSPHKDYHLWPIGPRIQEILGLTRAFAFEVGAVSAGLPFALETARGWFATHEECRHLLLVGASAESHLLDYRDASARFTFNFGDGAAAVVVSSDSKKGLARLKGSAFLTDGQFSRYVKVPAGGHLLPASHATVAGNLHHLTVENLEDMRSKLESISLRNFVQMGKEAMAKAGFKALDLLLPLHTKRSLFEAFLQAFGVPEERALYLQDTGHMSALDPLLALARVARERRNLLFPGARLLFLTAGTGYTWAASALEWVAP